MGLGKLRTIEELAAAIAYLEVMAKHAEDDLDKSRGKLVGTCARRGREMLLWAAGEDNTFGDMVAEAIASVDSGPSRAHARRSRKSAKANGNG